MEIVCITGTRADYGIYRPLLMELEKDPDFQLKLIVTGMHLLEEYGSTIHEVRADGFDIMATPSILLKGDSTYAMSQSLGMGILYFADILQTTKPKAILLLGDRGEMLAAAIAAHYQDIGIIHLHGGELSGSADDAIRHSISKLAHLHFVSTLKSKKNVIRLGEEEWRIIPIGSLRKYDVQRIKKLNHVTKEEWRKKYRLQSDKKKILLAMHPDSKERLSFTRQISEVLVALSGRSDTDILVIGSNSDAGGEIFRKHVLHFVEENEHTTYYPSIPSDEYLFLLSQVDLLVGNSSSGIIEAPFFQLPFINVGLRQNNREHAGNVVNVDYDRELIRASIDHVLLNPMKSFKENPYDVVDSPEIEMKEHLKLLLSSPILLNKNGVLHDDGK
jgi:GDP/UDP-N,N'-diacetylbacillosamine 2-epimerase (hydrolysing)